MPSDTPEAAARRLIDRGLERAGWPSASIRREVRLADDARADYVLTDDDGRFLCIIEAKRASEPDEAALLLPHLQQAQRYADTQPGTQAVPLLLVSDGELHFLQNTRTGRIARLYALPSRAQLLAVIDDPDALQDGYISPRRGLLPFQRAAIAEAVSRVMAGRRRLLLEMATGVGKTVVAAEVVNAVARVVREQTNRHASILFLVDRDSLESQAALRLTRDVDTLKVGTIGQVGNARVDVLVAQVATLQHRFDQKPFHPAYFDLVIVDEAHRSVHGETWREVVTYFDCPQIGLTATPPRYGDDETIEYFGEPVFLYSYEDGVRDGMLAPCVIHRVLTTVDRDGLVIGDRLYRSEDFGAAVQIENRDREIVRYYAENFYGRKCLVFAAGTAHLTSLWQQFSALFRERGDAFQARFIASRYDNAAARQAIVEEFEQPGSDVRVLINVNMLTAGFDYPDLDLLFMCRYTAHRSLYLQMKGRGSRIPRDSSGQVAVDEDGAPIKDRFYMVDFVGVTELEGRGDEATWAVGQVRARAEEPSVADRLLGGGPTEQTDDVFTPSVDVEVAIANVEIIDPFGVEVRDVENVPSAVVQLLRADRTAALADLARERESRRAQDESLQRARADLDLARARSNAAVWEAFLNIVASLRIVAPDTPITEALLTRINPELADSVERLSEACGVARPTLQAHADAAVREVPRRRYRALVDQSFLRPLTEVERAELDRSSQEIEDQDAPFYDAVIGHLDAAIAEQEDGPGYGNATAQPAAD